RPRHRCQRPVLLHVIDVHKGHETSSKSGHRAQRRYSSVTTHHHRLLNPRSLRRCHEVHHAGPTVDRTRPPHPIPTAPPPCDGGRRHPGTRCRRLRRRRQRTDHPLRTGRSAHDHVERQREPQGPVQRDRHGLRRGEPRQGVQHPVRLDHHRLLPHHH